MNRDMPNRFAWPGDDVEQWSVDGEVVVVRHAPTYTPPRCRWVCPQSGELGLCPVHKALVPHVLEVWDFAERPGLLCPDHKVPLVRAAG